MFSDGVSAMQFYYTTVYIITINNSYNSITIKNCCIENQT